MICNQRRGLLNEQGREILPPHEGPLQREALWLVECEFQGVCYPHQFHDEPGTPVALISEEETSFDD